MRSQIVRLKKFTFLTRRNLPSPQHLFQQHCLMPLLKNGFSSPKTHRPNLIMQTGNGIGRAQGCYILFAKTATWEDYKLKSHGCLGKIFLLLRMSWAKFFQILSVYGSFPQILSLHNILGGTCLLISVWSDDSIKLVWNLAKIQNGASNLQLVRGLARQPER